jgi:hypothetical protein
MTTWTSDELHGIETANYSTRFKHQPQVRPSWDGNILLFPYRLIKARLRHPSSF